MIFRTGHGIGCWSQLRIVSLGGHGSKLALTNLERVGASSIGIALARLRAANSWANATVTSPLCRRTYANRAVSRPKAHTGRTTSAPRKKAATRTRTKSAAQPKRKKASAPKKRRSATRAKSRSKARRPRKTSRAKPKAKRRTKKPLSKTATQNLANRKRIDEVKRLKERALSPPTSTERGSNSWVAFLAEQRRELRESGNPLLNRPVSEFAQAMKAKYLALSPAQLEHYNQVANQDRAKAKVNYTKWLEALTPAQIRDANAARHALRRRGLKPSNQLKDERRVTSVRTAFMFYQRERRASGDYRGLSTVEALKLIGSEWNATGPAERKKYQDLQKQDSDRYLQEHKSVYGIDAQVTRRKSTTANRAPSTRASTATVQ